MKAYIERPISEKPEKEGWYHTIGDEGFCYWSGNKWDHKITHWLQPAEIPDPSPVVNTDVLVDGLAMIRSLADKDDSGNSLSEAIMNICDEALSQFTTPQPDKKEEKK